MQFRRFAQIRAAFHPESAENKLDDKCHQIRYGLQKLNLAAKHCFIAGKELSFDEGGIPSKSRYNSVRQYNNSKPDKYRIDFFILANASEGHNFIIHIDVYQGKNSENVFIPRDIWDLPTTQKAVVNSIIATNLGNDPNGYRELYMDNRYSAPELFVMLKL